MRRAFITILIVAVAIMLFWCISAGTRQGIVLLTLLVAIALVAASILLMSLSDMSLKHRASRHMQGRPSFSNGEFGQHFYPEHAEIAARVREILSQHLPIDLSQLQPSDMPVIDLKMDDLDSMSTVEFVIALEQEFGIKIADADAEKMRSFDDVCTYVIARIEEGKGG